ncbi:hypothetical protein DL96DRAFT_1716078 [Flagelloscypha sp. PMI_526]|nr:hypothetical protein DL96DRAFT_1716078 [Flagelloscypha sp. PMI_526]
MCHRLEEDHQLEQPARVCDYFDMICGSGLGGLLAIMCGILCMTGEQLVEEFVQLCKVVFSGQLDVEQRTLLFSEIFFVDASDQVTLENSLRAIVSANSDQPSSEDALRLLRTRREDWLLFLDNANDPTLDLRPYVSWPHGNVLITTRNREIRSHSPTCSIWVDKLELADAMELLLRGVDLNESSKSHELALKIVQELGYLALAINQARAFLANGVCTLEEYLPIYARNCERLLEDKATQTTDDYQYSVYTTWTISFNRLSPDAALLLELLSQMHHESIPSRLFENAWKALNREGEKENTVPQTIASFLCSFTAVDSTWDVLCFRKLIREILSFSLLEFNTTNSFISLHPLVQRWAQHQSQHHEGIIPSTQTLLALATLTEWNSEDYAMRFFLLPHLRASMKNGIQLHYTFLARVGYVYQYGGMHREGFDMCQRALSETQQHFGPEHPDTLDRVGELAAAYRALGLNQEALELNEGQLEARRRIQGNEHPDTLNAMSDLALDYRRLGWYRDALKLNEEVLELRRRVLGHEHLGTQTTMINCALVYSYLGHYRSALELNEEVLGVRKRVLGHEHPYTLVTMSNLAQVYWDLGQHGDALLLGKEVVEVRKRVLGFEHPDTLTSMHNLAVFYKRMGLSWNAMKLNEEVLEVRKRVLDHEHPDILASMNNLVLVSIDLRQYQDALKVNEELLEVRKRVQGHEHPDTLAAMSSLAQIYSNLGQYQNAFDLHMHVIEVSSRVLGPKHPQTLANLECLKPLRAELQVPMKPKQSRKRDKVKHLFTLSSK